MTFDDGTVLEYRMLRLFLARGVFAERSLLPAVGDDYEKSATDIDVLAIEYGTGFNPTRVNVECKSGKNVSKLDRILWLAGVQQLLKADISYFLVQESEEDIARFAKDLNVATFTQMHLKTWEDSLGLRDEGWVARSNLNVYETVNRRWRTALREAKGSDPDLLAIKDVERFLKTDGWLSFSYSNLNRLLRLAEGLGKLTNRLDQKIEKTLFARLWLGALYVRFTQYLLEVCNDVLTLPPSQLDAYLRERLTFGDESFRNSTGLIEQTLSWVSHVLDARGIPMPAELNVNRLNVPPSYNNEFLSLVHKLLARSSEASQLVISAELLMFSLSNEVRNDHLRSMYQKGEHLALISKALFSRIAGIQAELLESLGDDLARHCGVSLAQPNATIAGAQDNTKQQKAETISYGSLKVVGNGQMLLGQTPDIDNLKNSEPEVPEAEAQLDCDDKEAKARDWVEKQVRDAAAKQGLKISGDLQWNRGTKASAVKLKLDGSKRTIELSNNQLSELSDEGKSRESFLRRLDEEIFAKSNKRR